ncbi:hypothetical protein B0H14DRAFT_2631032 [Mycena olivaceomarginata]|nr:hypothetical protein B0H14DRAFT_2631032 [Mycena olivaceomarginata]
MKTPPTTPLTPQTPRRRAERKKLLLSLKPKSRRGVARQRNSAKHEEQPLGGMAYAFSHPGRARPRRNVSDFQHYMRLDQYKEKVVERLRSEASCSRDSEVQQQMKAEAEALHPAALNKREDALEGLPTLDEDDLEDAQPLFKSGGTVTGGLGCPHRLRDPILVGRVKKAEGRVDVESLSLHAGVTAKTPAMLDFSRADTNVYGDVMRNFSRFVWNAHEFREGRPEMVEQGIAPPDSTVTPPSVNPPAPPLPTNPTAPPPPTNVMVPPTSTDVMAPHHPPPLQDSFSDAEIRAYLESGGPDPYEFDFPSHLLPGPVVAPLVLNGSDSSAPPIDAYRAGFAVPLSDLLMKLDAMPADARATRLVELQAMDAEGLARENTIARNQDLVGWSRVPPTTKHKSGGEGRKGSRKRAKRLDPVLRESENESGDNSNADEDPGPPPTQKEKARAPQAAAKSKGAAKDTKAWAATAQELLMQTDFGGGWTALVGVWWKREKRVGFEGTKQGHPARKRPTEVKDWIARARKYTPVIASAEAFGKGVGMVAGYQSGLARRRAAFVAGNRRVGLSGLVRSERLPQRANRVKWWRDAMDEASPDLDEAIADVTWCLRKWKGLPKRASIASRQFHHPRRITADPTGRIPIAAGYRRRIAPDGARTKRNNGGKLKAHS